MRPDNPATASILIENPSCCVSTPQHALQRHSLSRAQVSSVLLCLIIVVPLIETLSYYVQKIEKENSSWLLEIVSTYVYLESGV